MKQQTKTWILVGIFTFIGVNLIFNPDFPQQIAPYRKIIGAIALYRAWLVYKNK